MVYSHLQEWFDNEHDFNDNENSILKELLSKQFKGRDILLEQLSKTKVNGRCTCGCLTVFLNADSSTSKFPNEFSVPIEMHVKELNNLVIVMLHVDDGYVKELEILRADSEPILGPIDLTMKKIFIESDLEEESNSV
jgi:hypothetical protein